MDDRELSRIARTIVWDYRYDPESVADVLSGRRERIGHLDKAALFARMLKTMPWQRIVAALTLEEVKTLLTPETIARLWPPSLRERYARIRRLLRGDLYPLQSGVLSTLAACEAPFYLTGGTALHRHHFGYRYSDDLDLFVNQDPRFGRYIDAALAALLATGYRFDDEAFVRSEQYARVLITAGELTLKVDFVNDSAPRFGALLSAGLFPRIDSLRNILSNKVTAMYRLESKDIADLWAICSPFERIHSADSADRRCAVGLALEAAPVLSFHHVSKHFGGHDVLSNVSFQINPGDKVGLIGANGAGKSTVLHLLLGAQRPSAGSVVVGLDLGIGHVPQGLEAPPAMKVRDFLLGEVAPVRAGPCRRRRPADGRCPAALPVGPGPV